MTNNYGKTYSVYIDKDGIIRIRGMGMQPDEPIGFDNEAYENLEEKAMQLKNQRDEYKQMLIDAGLITVPKTPEQLAQEQSEINQLLLAEIKKLNNKVEELSNSGIDRKSNKEDSANAGKKSAGSGSSISHGKKDDSERT